MENLKMYLAEVDLEEGMISYSVENEAGDRVDKVTVKGSHIKDVNIVNMDLFLISYLPKLISQGNNIEVLGPISKGLSESIESIQEALIRSEIHPFLASSIEINSIEENSNSEYEEKDVVKFVEKHLEKEDLCEILEELFKYYK